MIIPIFVCVIEIWRDPPSILPRIEILHNICIFFSAEKLFGSVFLHIESTKFLPKCIVFTKIDILSTRISNVYIRSQISPYGRFSPHAPQIFSTGTACGACDKCQVCWGPIYGSKCWLLTPYLDFYLQLK